jgi:hypothetical protein
MQVECCKRVLDVQGSDEVLSATAAVYVLGRSSKKRFQFRLDFIMSVTVSVP